MENHGPNSTAFGSQPSQQLEDECKTRPLTSSRAHEWVASFNTLPPAAALCTLSPADLGHIIASPQFGSLVPGLLPAAFDDAPAESKPARLEAAALALVRQLDGGSLSDGVAKKSCEWCIGELQALGARQLVTLLETVLDGVGAALALPPASSRGYHLLPTILSHCSVVEAAEGLKTSGGKPLQDGAAVTSYALTKLQKAPWAAGSLVPLATMLRDLTLTPPQREKLVSKLLGRLSELDPNQLPALVYQLLLLADTNGKPEVRLFCVPSWSPGCGNPCF